MCDYTYFEIDPSPPPPPLHLLSETKLARPNSPVTSSTWSVQLAHRPWAALTHLGRALFTRRTESEPRPGHNGLSRPPIGAPHLSFVLVPRSFQWRIGMRTLPPASVRDSYPLEL